MQKASYVARVPYYRYAEGKEERGLGWLTRDGLVSSRKRDAYVYASEADAWEHLHAVGEAETGYVEPAQEDTAS